MLRLSTNPQDLLFVAADGAFGGLSGGHFDDEAPASSCRAVGAGPWSSSCPVPISPITVGKPGSEAAWWPNGEPVPTPRTFSRAGSPSRDQNQRGQARAAAPEKTTPVPISHGTVVVPGGLGAGSTGLSRPLRTGRIASAALLACAVAHSRLPATRGHRDVEIARSDR
jgi:hypothetical protein